LIVVHGRGFAHSCVNSVWDFPAAADTPGEATDMDYSGHRFGDVKLVVPGLPGFGIQLDL
jgi:hypothetical protein